MRKPLDKVITEEHEIAPLSPYAIGKYWGEMLLSEYMNETSINVVSLRVTSPISFDFNRLHNTVVKKWILQALEKRNITVLGQGGRVQDYIATEDIAKATIQALQHDASGVYNISSSMPLSNLALAEMIASWGAVNIELQGIDAYEDDCWNICFDKAATDFNFIPEYTSREVIEILIKLI